MSATDDEFASAYAADAARRVRADELYAEARRVRFTDYARVRELAEEGLELARELDADGTRYTEGMAAALSMLAYHNAVMGRSEEALSQASEAFSLVDTVRQPAVVCDLHDAVGWARFCRGDLVEALESLMRAHELAVELGDLRVEAYTDDAMASVHAVSGQPEEALEGHLKAIEINESIGEEFGTALVRNNLAYTYLALGDLEAASEAAEKALAFMTANGHSHVKMATLDTAATVRLEMGDLDAASAYAQRGLKLARELGFPRDACDSLITLGRIAIEQQRFDDAGASIGEALDLARELRRAVEEARCHELLSDIHERRGDAASALVEYRAYHDIERARVNAASATKLARLRVEHQFESAKKDGEIHRLRNLALEEEVEEHRIASARLEAQASLDALTGLYNRRHMEVLADELERSLGRGEPACLVLFDVDHFKRINDEHGHLTGDRVLVSISQQFARNSRASDVPCRFGGDEFLVLLAGMDSAGGEEAAERLRASIADTIIESKSGQVHVTISGGVACALPGGDASLPELLERADHALYEAKAGGRNRVVAAEECTL